MEDFEHSVRGPQVSATLSRKTSNGNGFTAKAVYDDVFGGPPKFGVRTFSSRVEDYSEIFGSFHSLRGSSIPILDLPVVDDGEVYSSKLDYCEIFGGFNGVDFAVSYEELFADPNKGGECSSEEAWTPGETGSVSEGSDSLACSERDQSLSNGASCNQFDGVNQFNLSFHKATQSSSEDGINGATHIAQLHAIPGYTFMVDEITHPQVTENNKPLPHVSDDSNRDMNFTEGGTEGKHFRKTNSFSPTSNADVQTWESDVKSQKGYGRSVSISNEMFLTISEINLTTQPCLVPPPSRPPPKFAIKRGDSNISMGSRIKSSHGRAVSDCSASYLDVEVDASSSAAASAAAMKEAMDKAQARIRSARESMEKKRDGIQNRRKLDLTDDLKRKDRDEGRASDGTNKLREERVQETCESANKGKRASAGEEMGKATRPDQVAPEFEDREIFRTLPKESLQEEHGKESRSSQEFHRQEGSECKASNRFCELENADKSRAAYRVLEQEKIEKKIVQSTKPLNCKESKKKEAEEAFELEQANYMKLTGDEEAIKLPQESCTKLEAAKGAFQREKKEIKTEAGDSSQKGEELKKKLKGAQGIPEPDGFDKLGVAMELKETEMKLEETHTQEKCEKKLKGAYEQKEKGKKLKEAREQEENVQKQKKAERQQNETRLKMFYESEEDERRLKQACEWEENEKRLKEAHLHGENESRLKEALEREEKEKRIKDSYLREENEKKLKKACKQEESEKKLKEACEQEENEKRLKEACWWEENDKQKEACVREESEKRLKEAHDGEEYGEKLKESFEKEEHERRLKELHKQEDNENRPKKACELEENEKRLKEVYAQEENEKRLKEASECEENETRQKEAYEREENEKRLEEANEREEVEGKLKVAYKACDHKEEKNLKISNEVFMNLKATKESSGDEEYDQELEDIREALEHIESGKIMRKDVVSSELPENGKESIPAKVSIELEGKERLETVKTSGLDQASHDNKENENTLKVATEACPSDESEMKLGEHDMDVRRQVENIEKVSQVPFEREKIEKRKTHELPGDVNNVKEAHAAFDQEENKNNLKTTQVSSTRSSENGTKMESYLGANMSDKNKTTKRAEDININQNVERKERSCNGTITIEEREKKEKMQRERELEKERLRKIEEERDREREREKDRMAVERATREARERAFADARERAERAAVDRATAEARQRAMAEAREKLEKASAEAREKSLSEKAYMEARLRAERAAVERATTEARERAVEKAMAERAASEARERSERFTVSKDGGMKQSSSSSDMQDPQFQSSGSFSGSRYPNYSNNSNNGGAEGESAQRCKARLERHQRTVQRAAKALAEKNLRDLLAQREQAERNRLAETLDADVKRWSNGKEGNLRALLSTLQYILGPDSGWQPIPLTDVITAVAVKKAYRKATLCVHPDKLQQRGASIQQKYICEKVFDLLKEAWNKFNSEER